MKNFLSTTALLLTTASVQTLAAPEVLPLYTEDVKKMALESIPPYPPEYVLKGTGENWLKVLHQGEVVVALYESKPALIDVKDPFPYDEFVVVLEGEVTLTAMDGEKKTYKTGENFLVPKGWTGTWRMPEHYREMIVVETKAWNESEG
jgi:uncharacterized cupin superfamily protein